MKVIFNGFTGKVDREIGMWLLADFKRFDFIITTDFSFVNFMRYSRLSCGFSIKNKFFIGIWRMK